MQKKRSDDHFCKVRHGKSSKAVTNFKVSAKVYALNDGKAKKKGERDLDRDIEV